MNTIQLTDEQCREGGAVSMVTVKVDELEGEALDAAFAYLWQQQNGEPPNRIAIGLCAETKRNILFFDGEIGPTVQIPAELMEGK